MQKHADMRKQRIHNLHVLCKSSASGRASTKSTNMTDSNYRQGDKQADVLFGRNIFCKVCKRGIHTVGTYMVICSRLSLPTQDNKAAVVVCSPRQSVHRLY